MVRDSTYSLQRDSSLIGLVCSFFSCLSTLHIASITMFPLAAKQTNSLGAVFHCGITHTFIIVYHHPFAVFHSRLRIIIKSCTISFACLITVCILSCMFVHLVARLIEVRIWDHDQRLNRHQNLQKGRHAGPPRLFLRAIPRSQ